MSAGDPPWFATDPETGEIIIEEVPERLATHPDLQRRGIVPADPLKLGFVYTTPPYSRPRYAIKILNSKTEELLIYKRLLRLSPASPNHTIPCELSQSGHPLLIMPLLDDVIGLRPTRPWTLHEMLSLFLQVVEGVEFLHRLHIVHMDLCPSNVLAAGLHHVEGHKDLVAGKVYIIDFDSARQLSLGPGKQPAVKLPPTQIDPPHGLRHFDPYSWDVYCAAHVLEDIIRVNKAEHSAGIARRYVQWLMGNERGCLDVCHCRPTARKAREVLVTLRLIVYVLRILRTTSAAADIQMQNNVHYP
ncbi:hypothetical protein OH77DRAFT_1431613 [Trametes cingulata]|nr:hypothetical protein OH77DRAFT_1431613 [Trametes cingulata]